MGQRGPNAKPVYRPSQVGPAEYKKNLDEARPWDKKGLSRAEKVVAFLETLPITSGNLAGQLFRVRDWQWRDIIEPLYRTDADGRRIAREGFISMPRRQGKTGIVCGLAACHLVGPEAVQRGNVASAAAERDQAGIIYDELKAIIELTPWMNNRIQVRDFKKELTDVITGSTYKALSSESKTKHGKGYSFWIYDELAQAPDDKLYKVFSTSGGSWDEPLGVVISTQSDDPKHIMSVLYDGAEQLQSGIVHDPTQQVCIYSAPMESDPWDEATWYGCNPALGDFRSLEDMRMLARKAKRMPSLEQAFRQLYLNQRVAAEARWIPRPVWEACGESPEVFDIESLRGRHCVGAMDLSDTGSNDLTALVLMFDIGDTMKLLPFFWAAEGGLDEAEARDRVKYRLWAEKGYLKTTPGKILQYSFIAKEIAELSTLYDIEVIAADPWHFKKMIFALEEIGANLNVKEHGQNIQAMSPCVKAAEDFATSGQLRHPRNEVLTWNVDNVMTTMDSSGNRKLDKRHSKGRIDGAVCFAMASGLLTAQEETATYEVTVI